MLPSYRGCIFSSLLAAATKAYMRRKGSTACSAIWHQVQLDDCLGEDQTDQHATTCQYNYLHKKSSCFSPPLELGFQAAFTGLADIESMLKMTHLLQTNIPFYEGTSRPRTQSHAAAAGTLSSDFSALSMASSDASGVSASACIKDGISSTDWEDCSITQP